MAVEKHSCGLNHEDVAHAVGLECAQVGELAGETQDWAAHVRRSLQSMCQAGAGSVLEKAQPPSLCKEKSAFSDAVQCSDLCSGSRGLMPVRTSGNHRLNASGGDEGADTSQLTAARPRCAGGEAPLCDDDSERHANQRACNQPSERTSMTGGAAVLSVATESPTSDVHDSMDGGRRTPPALRRTAAAGFWQSPGACASPLLGGIGVTDDAPPLGLDPSPLVSHYLARWLPLGCWRRQAQSRGPGRHRPTRLTTAVDVSPGRFLQCAAMLYAEGVAKGGEANELPVSVLVSPGQRANRAHAVRAEPEAINLVWRLYCVRQLPALPELAQALRAPGAPPCRRPMSCAPSRTRPRDSSASACGAVVRPATPWQGGGLRALWGQELSRLSAASSSSGWGDVGCDSRQHERVSRWLLKVLC